MRSHRMHVDLSHRQSDVFPLMYQNGGHMRQLITQCNTALVSQQNSEPPRAGLAYSLYIGGRELRPTCVALLSDKSRTS